MDTKDLLYFNEYGGFSKDGKEYIIKTNEKYTPAPWSHIIANDLFGTIITACGGGYVWCNNSRENKITTWSNDPVSDKPAEKIYIKNSDDSKIYAMPVDGLNGYEVHFGFGYAIFKYQNEEVKQELLVYVPINQNKKVSKLVIENLKEEEKECEVCFYIEPVLGVSREYTKKHLNIKKIKNGVKIKNFYRDFYQNQVVYISCNLDTEVEINEQKEVLLKSKIKINPKDKIVLYFEIEVQDAEVESQEIESINNEIVTNDLENIKNFWHETLEKIKIKTPVESMNIIMNGWLGYQTLVSRLWGRTSFYQAGGAFGFRDQLQDSLMMLYLKSELARKQILYHAAHQFKEGDVLHWWHPEKSNGIRTRYTDDLLWLPYLISEYISKENDFSILDEQVSYVYMEELKDDEGERYGEVTRTDEKETLYEHAIRAIEKSLSFGRNGIPNMGTGDWNDGMNGIRGQSVWLGFFMYDVIKRFIKICEYKTDNEKVEKYKVILEELKKALNSEAWDGKWYRRAFFENGIPLGSSENDECKIDGISQSFSVISGAGEYEKCISAMDSLENYLVDKENLIIKLLTPPFSKTSLEPGYIKSYIPGVRENGGQYTQVCCC